MADIVDLAARRAALDAPDADCVRIDQDGTPMFRFGLEYRMDDKAWAGIELWAYSFEDAELRVAAIRESLTLFGQVVARGSL